MITNALLLTFVKNFEHRGELPGKPARELFTHAAMVARARNELKLRE